MESSVFRTLNMLQTSRGRNLAIIDDSYKECLSTVCVPALWILIPGNMYNSVKLTFT